MFRVAVIGLGSIGRRHSKNLLSLGCEIAGYDSGQKAIWYEEEAHQARTLDDIWDWKPGALVIATPWDQHLPWVRMAA
jgi:phosphoglycerate dehydrogenase-like enzyme